MLIFSVTSVNFNNVGQTSHLGPEEYYTDWV